ncbi:Calcium/proton exchanger [Clavulina sp. PMI_390]|nr:Calcium/proton exchanger [Clavulina sp. PMI_390]
MPYTENTPLLGLNGSAIPRSFGARVVSRIKAEGEPTWGASIHEFLFSSWLNILLLFIPLSTTAHFNDWDAGLQFSLSFLAIMPLAKLLGDATEQVSLELDQTLGDLLIASFGNAVEVIVGLAALLQGELRIVQTSMLGSILSNIILDLGMAFFVGGIYRIENEFHITAAKNSVSIMTLSCITLVIPAAYHATQLEPHRHKYYHMPGYFSEGAGVAPQTDPVGLDGLLTISRGTSILLLLIYAAFLFFQLKTHTVLFDNATPAYLEETVEAQGPEDEVKMNMASAGLALLTVTVITSFCASWLVASIEETAKKYSIPRAFIGLILLPIVANAAKHVTSVWMAANDNMELAIAIAIGSSIQISTFVVPLLVLVGWFANRPLTLFFADFETIIFFMSIILVNLLVQDGRSNYLEGLILVVLYIVIALTFWVS